MRRNEYIPDDMVVHRANEAVRIELEKMKAMNIPAVIYDSKTQTIYHQYSDGTRVAVSGRLKRGRYSEYAKKKA